MSQVGGSLPWREGEEPFLAGPLHPLLMDLGTGFCEAGPQASQGTDSYPRVTHDLQQTDEKARPTTASLLK